ncbi:alpha/beta hydrolase [Methylobacterium sp. J-076]|uniref:alpha/beta hydrolase n=1 Tax=Methylobacterium sp. J-076 TaxID=2836655 RepID=UPI001FB9CE6E|nr:alpha/beta hydrolase [Methylobacterium sp. J-076]MCJ2013678.1 alpha/beta hydrolase [Methylobacterium sp. J-076]
MADTHFVMAVEGHGPKREIAGRVRDGAGPPVVWLGGFRSDMNATKASALDGWAEEAGRRFVRFDYGGHGASGGRFEECTISSWLDDAQAVIAAHADEAPVLVGSSMGGWIACLAARERARQGKRTAGLVLIAPALDFTEALLWASLPEDQRRAMEARGYLSVPSEYDPRPTVLTMKLVEDGRAHLMLGGPVTPGCPVHILQGGRDPDVPHAHAFRLLERLPAEDTVLTFIADGDHRLSRPRDIARLVAAVAGIT